VFNRRNTSHDQRNQIQRAQGKIHLGQASGDPKEIRKADEGNRKADEPGRVQDSRQFQGSKGANEHKSEAT